MVILKLFLRNILKQYFVEARHKDFKKRGVVNKDKMIIIPTTRTQDDYFYHLPSPQSDSFSLFAFATC